AGDERRDRGRHLSADGQRVLRRRQRRACEYRRARRRAVRDARMLARHRIAAHASRNRAPARDDAVKLLERRREVEAARAELRRRELEWSIKTTGVRAWCRTHRAGLIVGGGVGAGFVASLLPVTPLLRLASALAGTVSMMFEGPLLRMLAAHREDAA